MSEIDPLRPVADYFPGRTLTWIAKSCRACRIHGAVKVGNVWMIRESSIAAMVEAANAPPTPYRLPTVEEVAAERAALGLLPVARAARAA